MAVGPSFSYTAGEPMGASSKADLVVLVESIDGGSRIIGLDSVFSGTVILVDYEEYMKVLNGTWTKHTGDTVSHEELASRIRKAQNDDLSIILIHIVE